MEENKLRLYKFDHYSKGPLEVKAMNKEEALYAAWDYYNWGMPDIEFIGVEDIEKNDSHE